MKKVESRKRVKGVKTRAHLLQTALKLFAEKGFEATTMREIAKNADLSLGASYHHFRGKDELVLAFYQSTADEARDENPKLMQASKRFEVRFHSILDFKLKQL